MPCAFSDPFTGAWGSAFELGQVSLPLSLLSPLVVASSEGSEGFSELVGATDEQCWA